MYATEEAEDFFFNGSSLAILPRSPQIFTIPAPQQLVEKLVPPSSYLTRNIKIYICISALLIFQISRAMLIRTSRLPRSTVYAVLMPASLSSEN